ncbi:hypothetical protein CAP36_14175 [Chitinophagaceae bacterium IBVUCB2]|nr:hypothetical protein CAP36_14175 [Chitinophagaceae bacterium IBVUCB2]
MKKIICSSIIAVGALQASAQETDMQALKRLNATFIHNFVTNDTASHSAIIHADFIRISSEGEFMGRKEYLEGWATGFNGFIYWDYRKEDIKIVGTMALVRSQNKYVFEKDGKEMEGVVMYTDTYIKENGEWKCIQAQIGKVAPQFAAGDETIVRKYDFRKNKK